MSGFLDKIARFGGLFGVRRFNAAFFLLGVCPAAEKEKKR
jgi:hypothetical protein